MVRSGADKTLYLFDKDKDKPVWQFKAEERVGSVRISADGNYLVAGSKDKTVYFFERKNQPLWNYLASTWVNAMTISSDGNFLAAGTSASQYLAEGHNTEEAFESKMSSTFFPREKPKNPLPKN